MLELSSRDKWFIGTLYCLPPSLLGAALFMAFFHAKDWAARHNDGGAWEHWAFAVIIELPAIFAILLMALWPKIGGGRKPMIPRILFLTSAGLSQYVQQAYAGPDASASERFVAGVPSVGAMVFIELVFWVMGLIDEAKAKAKEEFAEAEEEKRKLDERPRVGLGDIAAPPALSPRHDELVSPPVRADMSPPTPEPVSPGHAMATSTSAPARVTPSPRPRDSQTWGVTSVAPEGDNAQLKTHVTPGMSPIYVAPPRHPDTGQPQGDTDPTVTPGIRSDVTADEVADVTPDAQPDMTDPRWVEAADMRMSGATIKAIAEHFNLTTRTINRWKLPTPAGTKPVNGHTPDLTGAER